MSIVSHKLQVGGPILEASVQADHLRPLKNRAKVTKCPKFCSSALCKGTCCTQHEHTLSQSVTTWTELRRHLRSRQ